MKSPYDLSMRQWLEVSLEVDNRAKIYNLFKDKTSEPNVQNQGRDIQGIIPYQYFSKRFEYDNLSSASWDWVFGPLIQLIFKLELATWVCLGHFKGGYSRWLYYFSQELSPPLDSPKNEVEEMRNFLRAYRCFSYNAWRKHTKPPILLTSTLMQEIMSANIDDKEFPQGASLFLSFKSNSLKSKSSETSLSIPYLLWTIDLREEAKRVLVKNKIWRNKREKILEEVCPYEYISDMVSEFLYSGNQSKIENRIISFCPNDDRVESIKTKISSAARKYDKALKDIFNNGDTFLPSDRFSEKLLKYYNKYRETKYSVDADLARYVVWMHDSVDILTGVLCIPAWLPPGSESSESASLIVCLKRPVSSYDLMSMISAFRLGSSSVAIRSEREISIGIGLEEAINAFSHEVGKIGSKLLSEYVYDLDEIFDLGKSEPDEKSDLFEFKKICKLDIINDLKDVLKGWGVFPLKEMTEGLMFLLQVWGGSRNLIKFLKIKNIGKRITIGDLIKNLSDKIKNIAVTRKVMISTSRPLSLEGIENFRKKYKDSFKTTANLAPPDGSGADLKVILGDNQPGPVSVFIRLLAALLSNSIYHAVDNTEVKVQIYYRKSEEKMKIEIINESDIKKSSETDILSDFSIGSRGVAQICLEKLKGRLIQFPGRYDETGVTSFEVPTSKIKSKGGFIEWIQEK